MVDAFKQMAYLPVMRQKKGVGGQVFMEVRRPSPPRRGLLRTAPRIEQGTPTKPGEEEESTKQPTTYAQPAEEGEREAKRPRQEERDPSSTPEEELQSEDHVFAAFLGRLGGTSREACT